MTAMPFARTPIASSTQSTCRAACHSKLVFPQRVGCVESNGVVGNGIPGKARAAVGLLDCLGSVAAHACNAHCQRQSCRLVPLTGCSVTTAAPASSSGNAFDANKKRNVLKQARHVVVVSSRRGGRGDRLWSAACKLALGPARVTLHPSAVRCSCRPRRCSPPSNQRLTT